MLDGFDAGVEGGYRTGFDGAASPQLRAIAKDAHHRRNSATAGAANAAAPLPPHGCLPGGLRPLRRYSG